MQSRTSCRQAALSECLVAKDSGRGEQDHSWDGEPPQTDAATADPGSEGIAGLPSLCAHMDTGT